MANQLPWNTIRKKNHNLKSIRGCWVLRKIWKSFTQSEKRVGGEDPEKRKTRLPHTTVYKVKNTLLYGIYLQITWIKQTQYSLSNVAPTSAKNNYFLKN